MGIGAQLYTLRQFTQSEKDLGRSLERVKALGYDSVQLSAIGPIPQKRIKQLCDQSGLSIVLTHNPEEAFLKGIDQLVETHLLYGCSFVGLGSLPHRYRSPGWLDHFAEDFGPAAQKLSDHGLRFMYHHHAFEFTRLPSGQTLMDRLFALLPEQLMGLTADTYWLQAAGVELLPFLHQHPRRLHCVHLKDYAMMGDCVRMAAVGQGNLNFPGILKALSGNHTTRHLLVEQDDCYGEDPFTCLKTSLDHLRQLLARK